MLLERGGRVFCFRCVAVFSFFRLKKILTENQRRDARDDGELGQSKAEEPAADDVLLKRVY